MGVLENLKRIFGGKKKTKVKKKRVIKKKKAKRKKKFKHLIKLKPIKVPIKKKTKKILVKDIMTKKIIPIDYNWDLAKTAKVFMKKKISGGPVLRKSEFVGEISKTDVLNIVKKDDLRKLDKKDFEKLSKIKVFEIMKKPITIREDKTIEEARLLMINKKISRLLVVNKDNKLIGIITKTDLSKIISKKKVEERVKTKIDEMLEMIEKNEKISLNKISEQLRVPISIIEEWAKILEEHDVVEIEYPPIGSPIVKKVKQE